MSTETLDRIFLFLAVFCIIFGTVLQCRTNDYTESAKRQAIEALELVKAQNAELQKVHDINRRMYKSLDLLSKDNQEAIREIRALDSTYQLSLDSNSLAIQRKRQVIETMLRNIFKDLKY